MKDYREIVLDILEAIGASRDFWAKTQGELLDKAAKVLEKDLGGPVTGSVGSITLTKEKD